MPILERLQNHFPSYVWRHVLSMLVGLMLLREAKTLTALQCQESLPTLSRTLNVYEWPLDELRAVRHSLIIQALKREAPPEAGQTSLPLPDPRRYGRAQAGEEAAGAGVSFLTQ